MFMRYLLFSVIVLFVLQGSATCEAGQPAGGVPEGLVVETAGAAAGTGADKGADAKVVAKGNTAFALDLYARLTGGESMDAGSNLCFSPLSISTALAMTYAGAREETAEQMEKVLHFTLGQERFHPAFSSLLINLEAANHPGLKVRVADALWNQEGEGLLDPFLELTRRCYGASLREVDFAGAGEEARQSINRWVAKRTEGKIKELLLPGDLDASVRLVLTNAIYFKGSWENRFDGKETRDRPFQISEEEQITVPMMYQFGAFPFSKGKGLDLIELPYQGSRLSMVILLPGEVNGLPRLEASLTPENLDRWLAGLKKDEVRVFLPRFKVSSRFDLAKVLSAMGMADAFSPGRADFSGMTGKKDLFISAVIHQALAEVNEEGTEAAAATAVIKKRGYASFNANRPFIYLIRDRETGSIFFMGRVMNPLN